MKSLSLLLLGDIHFPDFESPMKSVDYKDKGFPARLVERIAPDRLQNVARAISKQHQNDESINAILICGDLTSRGDLGGYRKCVDYLTKSLQILDQNKWENDAVHIVPGNHDVDRSLCKASSELLDKFKPLSDAWSGPPARTLTVDGMRHTTVRGIDGPAVALFSINSCLGCGESRHFPQELQVLNTTTKMFAYIFDAV